jgi:hypothetical protein
LYFFREGKTLWLSLPLENNFLISISSFFFVILERLLCEIKKTCLLDFFFLNRKRRSLFGGENNKNNGYKNLGAHMESLFL